MYANLHRIAGEDQRVLAIVGADHARILIDLLRASQRYDVADVLDHLPKRGSVPS
jgi:pheromone shutdown protein TraB